MKQNNSNSQLNTSQLNSEIENLNLEDLDIQELEQRIELADLQSQSIICPVHRSQASPCPDKWL